MDTKVVQMLETKKHIRKRALEVILDRFDGELMGLSYKDRKRKYGKMKNDPYSFFRGSAYLFFHDVTELPFSYHTPKDRPTWIMGDLHFDNFSVFQNEKRDIVFDVDDFDEGYLGSYLYDVMRMAVSIRLTMENLGYSEDEQDKLVDKYLKSYTKQMKSFQDREVDPQTMHVTKDESKSAVKKAIKKVEQRKHSHELEKQTVVNSNSIRSFDIGKDKLSSVPKQEYEKLKKAWESYYDSLDVSTRQPRSFYRIKDVVKKVGSGIGSTGLNRYYILIEGSEEDHKDDIILEAKEARTPIPAYFFPYDEQFWLEHRHQGRRVMHTQQAMHHLSDPYLGYFSIDNHDYYVRERSPFSKDLKEKHLMDYKSMKQTIKTMAQISAKIHARADADIDEGILPYHSEDAIIEAIGSNQKGFRRQLSLWSSHYKQKVIQDYELFIEWGNENGYF
ncbi:DUF2252 domain-containing protein [Halobacillus litoralis]|uniref:DUF2252 domain-containing protein n=1 Tax=Halobacillus litoralis TaxID=45668 RepID=UPI001CFDB519|nr:DUF2252 family protein [Halobacillus litoralis]